MIAATNDFAFREYCRCLVRLHQLIRQNQDGEVEGESLRDAMDEYWSEMTPDEIEAVGRLSEDLYLLSKPRPGELDSPPAEFVQAYSSGDWIRSLDILREHQAKLPLDVASLVHGAVWAQRGYPEIACEFLRTIQRQRPLTGEEWIWFVPVLLAAGELEEARQQIDVLLASGDPKLELMAAEVLSLTASEASSDEARAIREKAVFIAERALAQAPSQGELWRVMRVAALLHLAFNLHALHRDAEANAACAEAIRLDPYNDMTYALMGWLAIDQQSPELSAPMKHRLPTEMNNRLQHQIMGLVYPALSTV